MHDVRETILPQIDTIIQQERSKSTVIDRLKHNIEAIQQDIYLCEAQIENSLGPEYSQQDFRKYISIVFALMVGILILAFFLIVYLKSNGSTSNMLLGENGLQFISLFVLIIAIILFGILNILEGRELAAILSGISGYMLGRGANNQRQTTDSNI